MNLKNIAYHLLFWIVLTIAFAVSQWGQEQSLGDSFIFQFLYLPSRLLAVYLNWVFLIPLILNKERFAIYIISLVILLTIITIAHRFFILYWGYPSYFPNWVDSGHIHIIKASRLLQHAIAIFYPVAITTLYKFFKNWFRQRQITENLKKEKATAELKFLKFQTNPHFLFNTLNSIYGLALEKSNKTPGLILKLSEILNYTLYESNRSMIDLNRELLLIQNIIDLEKERYGNRVEIEYNKNGNPKNVKIPPLILIPFVENAFKHGLRNETKKGWIKIGVCIGQNKLSFTIENSHDINYAAKEISEGGLGLKNVKRRLKLIYGENHNLFIKRDEKSFFVHLRLKNL